MHSVGHMAMIVVMFAVVGGSLFAAPPSSPPAFLQFQVAEEQPEVVAQPLIEEDYGIWNPPPHFDRGGYGAPIPHAKAACCPHLPCCSHFKQWEEPFAN